MYYSINGGAVTAGNDNGFYAVTLTGGTYDFDGKGNQPTIDGGEDGTGTLIIGTCDAKIEGSFAKIDGEGALYLEGDTTIGATEREMNVYSNHSYKLTLGDGETASEDITADVRVTLKDKNDYTYSKIGTVIVNADAALTVTGVKGDRGTNNDNAYTVTEIVGAGGSVEISAEKHEYQISV